MNLDEQIERLMLLKDKVAKYTKLIEVVEKQFDLPEVVDFLNSRIEQISNPTPQREAKPQPQPQPHKAELQALDPIRFALKFRSSQGKEVTVNTKDGPVAAKVVGVNAPNIIVETDTGHTVHIPPQEIEGLEA